MFIVVDVNVVLSSLLGKGNSFNVFALNNLFNKFNFVAPEFLLTELEKHKEEILKRSRLSKDIFDGTLNLVLGQVTFISKSDFSEFLPEAKKLLSVHLKDVQYLALSLKLDCPVFSGDKAFKKIFPSKVLSPKEMLDKF